MATDKTQGLPHVAAPTAAEITAAALAPFAEKRLASLIRSRDAIQAELKIIFGIPGFDGRVNILTIGFSILIMKFFPSLTSE